MITANYSVFIYFEVLSVIKKRNKETKVEKITLKTLLYIPILHIVIFTIVAHTAYRLRTPDSSSGVSDQQSVGSSPGCDTCAL